MKRLLNICLFLPLVVYGQLTGKVISVADGDTFTMVVNEKQIRVRLHGIDCPEKGQDYSQVAKSYLSDLVFGKTVTVKRLDTDRYGRTIGMVTIDTINVNESLLKAGLAWHYSYYDKNPEWAAMEAEAKRRKIGLWSLDNPIAPWDFRRSKRVD